MALLNDAIGYGTIGARPAAGSPGRIYFSTEPASYRDNGSSWDDVSDPGTGSGIPDTILDAKGDIIAASAADTAAKVTVGANNTALIADSAQAAGVKWAHPILSTLTHTLTADVTMTTANTFYDGPTVSLTAGTWLLVGSVFVENTSGTAVTEFGAKLWDGTTVESAADWLTRATNDRKNLNVAGIVTVGSTTSWKISAVNTQNNCTIRKASANNNAGDKYSWLRAVRVA